MMNGLTAHPAGTLVERALELLRLGPAGAGELAVKVLGLPNAPGAVAERIAVALLGADPRVRQQVDGRWALVAAAQGSPLLEECAFAVVDVETTGMQPGGNDRITEIAVVVVHGTRRDVVFESLVNPGRPIPARICELTGISQEMVDGAPAFVDIADQLLAALAGRVFVAHNARFDWGFVGAEVRRARDLSLDGPRLCTVRLARRLVRGEPSYSLGALAMRFGLEFAARHRAAGDALVTGMLLQRLLTHARDNGARTLADLEILHRAPLNVAA
jgi:DNA polymerase-3 subunit epsilon